MPFPAGPGPLGFSHITSPNRCNIFYVGDTPSFSLSAAGANAYTIRDYFGNIVSSGSIAGLVLPALSAANDLALGAVSWYQGGANVSDTDISPAFVPQGAGTNHFGLSSFANGAYWKISSSSLGLTSNAGVQFATTFTTDSGWGAGLLCVKSATGQTAAVVRAVACTNSAPATTLTQTVTATSTGSLLVMLVGNGGLDDVTGVTDSGGNTWTRCAHISGVSVGLETFQIYTTTVANPASITSVTVTRSTAEIMNGMFYEVSGANNTSPVDIATVGFGYGRSGSAQQASAGPSFTPAVPTGGWKPGWYRLYVNGSSTDPNFGTSLGATNFCVVKTDSRFATNPAVGTNEGVDPAFVADDNITRGVLCIGPARHAITDVLNPAVGIDWVQQEAALLNTYYTPYAPSNRPRPLLASFPNGATDALSFFRTGTSALAMSVYVKDPSLDGSTITVAIDPGTVSGIKVTVAQAGGATEVYDNLANTSDGNGNAVAAMNATSALVKAFTEGGAGQVLASPIAARPIGNAYHNNVVSTVATLFASGITRFEGPSNEPSETDETAHRLLLFNGAVKAGNAAAVTVGPGFVTINNLYQTNPALACFDFFLRANGGAYVDEISFHFYNGCNGNLNAGRQVLDNWVGLLTKYGLQNKPRWQTEQGVFTAVYGVYHPRRARWQILQILLLEQYNIPREHNVVWYDTSHGFWGIPAFWRNADKSLNPQTMLLRTLAEETYDKPFTARLRFGQAGDALFLGSVYTGADGSQCVALMAGSAMPSSSVTLALSGTVPPVVTAVDAFGNTSLLSSYQGRLVVPVAEVPTYVRIPATCTVAVYTVNGWPAAMVSGNEKTYNPTYKVVSTATNAGGSLPAAVDGAYEVTYNGAADAAFARGTCPDTHTHVYRDPQRIDRVVVWSGFVWQSVSTLLDFDVQTSVDGSTAWTTQATVTRTASSFLHGTDSLNVGCTRETYFDEQFMFDCPFPGGPVTVKGVRINVRATTYGGEPDAAAVVAGGQGNNIQQMYIEEIGVYCDDNTVPRYFVA